VKTGIRNQNQKLTNSRIVRQALAPWRTMCLTILLLSVHHGAQLEGEKDNAEPKRL